MFLEKKIPFLLSIESEVTKGMVLIRGENLELEGDMSEVIFTVDSYGTILEASRYQVFTILGYLSSELVGKNIGILLSDTDVETILHHAKKKKKILSSKASLAPVRVQVKHRTHSSIAVTLSVFDIQSPMGEKQFCILLRKGDDVNVPKLSYLKQQDKDDDNDDMPRDALLSFASYVLEDAIDDALGGTVYTAKNKRTGESVIVKVQDKRKLDANQKERLNTEYNIAHKLNHPNIINYLDQIDLGDHVFTVLEYGKDGNLDTYLTKKGKLDEEEANKFFSQLVNAVSYCHNENCVHGDIKLSNVVMNNGDVKLIDFSVSKQSDTPLGKRETFCGTTQYVAPEVLMQNIYPGKIADIWSLGVCLFVMVAGTYPFDSLASTMAGKFIIPSHVSDGCSNLIQNILKINTSERYSLAQIQEHPWLMLYNKVSKTSILSMKRSASMISSTE